MKTSDLLSHYRENKFNHLLTSSIIGGNGILAVRSSLLLPGRGSGDKLPSLWLPVVVKSGNRSKRGNAKAPSSARDHQGDGHVAEEV